MKETDIVAMDKTTTNVTGVAEGETTVSSLLKTQGNRIDRTFNTFEIDYFFHTKHRSVGRGLHSTEVAYLLLTQQPRVRFPVFLNFFRGKIVDVAEVNQRR